MGSISLGKNFQQENLKTFTLLKVAHNSQRSVGYILSNKMYSLLSQIGLKWHNFAQIRSHLMLPGSTLNFSLNIRIVESIQIQILYKSKYNSVSILISAHSFSSTKVPFLFSRDFSYLIKS